MSAATRRRAVLFDLDGTLVDSLADIGDALNAVLAERGHPTHARVAYQTLVGDGARELVRRALPPDASGELDAVLAAYKARYHAHLVVETRPYDGVVALLETLASRGLALAVVTNKPHEAAVEIVRTLFAPGTFEVVLGQKEGVPHKPDPAGPNEVLARLGVAAADAFFVGDTSTDMRTAVNAELVGIGVTWGFRGRDELLAHGATVVVDTPEEIARFVG